MELRHKKKENLDNYFTLARATEEELQETDERVETRLTSHGRSLSRKTRRK